MEKLMKRVIISLIALVLSSTANAHPDDNSNQSIEVAAMASAAQTFLATLSDQQRSIVKFSLSDQTARRGWSNLPTPMVPRRGLQIKSLSSEQRAALHALLARGLSSEGYGEAVRVMTLEDTLRTMMSIERIEGLLPERLHGLADDILESFDPENYWVRIFGVPGGDSWAWSLDGHHLAITVTAVDHRIAFTPLFLGAEPQTILEGRHAGSRSFQHELDRVSDFLKSLSSVQTDSLVQSADVASGPAFAGPSWVPDFEMPPLGLNGSDLSSEQQALLFSAINEFIGAATASTVEHQRAKILSDGFEVLNVAWWGNPADLSQQFMFRISGPSIHIDFTLEGQGNHVHIVVRDPSNDYGEHWLEQHYSEAH
jgi:Protein of unknown function (DUF3500)